jgi:hypothetical protein
MAKRKFKSVRLTFVNDDAKEQILEYKLVRSPARDAWVSQIEAAVADRENLVHLGTANVPTPERLKRHWDIVRYFTNLANQDHLLDEWLHLPQTLDLEQDNSKLFNELRARCQAYEMYASVNQQESETRANLKRVSRAISIFEYVLNSGSDKPAQAYWFKSQNPPSKIPNLDQDKHLTNKVSYGDLVMLGPGISRTANEARLANDVQVVKRNMISEWLPSPITLLAFSDFYEDLAATQQWLVQQGSKLTAKPSYCIVGKLVTEIAKDELGNLLNTYKISSMDLIQ